jgi:hypothetical protein
MKLGDAPGNTKLFFIITKIWIKERLFKNLNEFQS